MTIKEILPKETKTLFDKKIKSAALDAEILLLHTFAQSKNKPRSFNNDRSWLYAHNDYELAKPQKSKFYSFIKRREKFEPVAYITGKKEFFGLDFYVNKNVLIPRPETEILVENALKEILKDKKQNKKMIIADIGTGTGAIAVSIAKVLKDQNKLSLSAQSRSEPICFCEQRGKQGVPIASKNNWRASPLAITLKPHNNNLKNTTIYATDISPKALKIAKKNAKNHNCDKNIIFKKGNLLKALPKNTKIDFLLANLPYVGDDYYYYYYYYYKWLKNGGRPSEFHEIKHEPKKSLLAKNNGLEYFNEFFPILPKYISKNSKIFLESDPFQIPAIKKLAKKYLPKHKISVIKDLRGLNRITKIEIIL